MMSGLIISALLGSPAEMDRQPDLSGMHIHGAFSISLEKMNNREGLYRMKWYDGNFTCIGEGTLVHRYGGIYQLNGFYDKRVQESHNLALFGNRLIPTSRFGCFPIELKLRRKE